MQPSWLFFAVPKVGQFEREGWQGPLEVVQRRLFVHQERAPRGGLNGDIDASMLLIDVVNPLE